MFFLNMDYLETPCHIIDLDKIKNNISILSLLKKKTNIKILFALKGFSNDKIVPMFIDFLVQVVFGKHNLLMICLKNLCIPIRQPTKEMT